MLSQIVVRLLAKELERSLVNFCHHYDSTN